MNGNDERARHDLEEDARDPIPDEPIVAPVQHNHDGPGDCPVCPTDYDTDPADLVDEPEDGATLVAGVLYDNETGEEVPASTMRVMLRYRCDVMVLVNNETGEIEEVHVDDEGVERVTDDPGYNRDGLPEPTDADFAAAIEIAENGDWPGWEFGF